MEKSAEAKHIKIIETKKQKSHSLSVFVCNKPGVLMRICQVFSRRAYNIDSLVVSHSQDRAFSKMTISINGDPNGLDQIIKQVSKLIDVIECIEYSTDHSVTKELALIKIALKSDEFIEISRITDHFEGKTISLTNESVITMIHGDSERIDWAIQTLSKFELIEIIRSGKIVMSTALTVENKSFPKAP